ncbi:MAG: response regulator transcription factor [Actinomycetota bacterium]|nr:response regulator transcription factor [Actinomycetota bacterium]
MRLILIVETDPRLTALLEERFRARGYATSTVPDSRSAGAVVQRRACHLVVVDSTALGANDLHELKEIAARERLPVVAIAAKPFQFDALLARVHRRLERNSTDHEIKLSAGSVELDPWTRHARIDELEVALTGREFALLEFFLRHPGELLSRERLHASVWGYDHDPGSNVIEVYIGYLRKKLGVQLVETVHGKGYRLNA